MAFDSRRSGSLSRCTSGGVAAEPQTAGNPNGGRDGSDCVSRAAFRFRPQPVRSMMSCLILLESELLPDNAIYQGRDFALAGRLSEISDVGPVDSASAGRPVCGRA